MNGAADDPLLGQVIEDRYRVLRVLGRGGMGTVYEAEQTRLGRRVAIKTIDAPLATDPAMFQRFEREALAAASVGSPHIVEVIDRGVLPGARPYMVMELLDGEDLEARLARGPLEPELAIDIARQTCKALAAAHRHGIVHRDVKPANVMLIERPGEPPFVKVVDFGISKLRDSALTGTHDMLGTPYAMAPEQLRDSSRVDARADVYAVGVMLFHALTGRPPYEAPTLPSLIQKILDGERSRLAQLAPRLPPALTEIVDVAMSPRPEDRFQSCDALAVALGGVSAEPTREPPTVDPFSSTMAAPARTSPVAPAPTPHALQPTPPTPHAPQHIAPQPPPPQPQPPALQPTAALPPEALPFSDAQPAPSPPMTSPLRWVAPLLAALVAAGAAAAYVITRADEAGPPESSRTEASPPEASPPEASAPDDGRNPVDVRAVDAGAARPAPPPEPAGPPLATIPDVPMARPRPAPPGTPTLDCVITLWPPMRVFVDGEDLGLSPIVLHPIPIGVRSVVAREENGSRWMIWLHDVGARTRSGGPRCSMVRFHDDHERVFAAYPPRIGSLLRWAQARGAGCGHGTRQTLHLRIRPDDSTNLRADGALEVTGGDAEANECLYRLMRGQSTRAVQTRHVAYEIDVPVH